MNPKIPWILDFLVGVAMVACALILGHELGVFSERQASATEIRLLREQVEGVRAINRENTALLTGMDLAHHARLAKLERSAPELFKHYQGN